MHHVLFVGPLGCGKSMLADAFPSIFPPLEEKQQIEVLSVYQLAQKTCDSLPFPPIRSPHHSFSAISLIGGGTFPKPGEISLAHRGILFLDEIAEYPKKTLDLFRQPLEMDKCQSLG